MEGHCWTGQSSQWAVVLMEEEEEEEEENAGNLVTRWDTVKFSTRICCGELIGLLVWFSFCTEHCVCKRR